MACIIHKWKGCTCAKCGATRHAFDHPEFGGCVCKRCGLINPNRYAHRINPRGQGANRCYCPRCKEFFHEWDGCKCKLCFEPNHKWDGCICEICGKKQPYDGPGHDWDGCICRKCNTKKQADSPDHAWEGCRCQRCRMVRKNLWMRINLPLLFHYIRQV